MPSIETDEPRRANDLKDNEEPMFTKSKIEIDAPRRANDLKDIAEPRLTKSRTASDDPTRLVLKSENDEPIRAI
jgi:hypothetical protein